MKWQIRGLGAAGEALSRMETWPDLSPDIDPVFIYKASIAKVFL